jgi:hypothetical protein
MKQLSIMAGRKNDSDDKPDSGIKLSDPCLLLLVVISIVIGFYFCILPFISALYNYEIHFKNLNYFLLTLASSVSFLIQ